MGYQDNTSPHHPPKPSLRDEWESHRQARQDLIKNALDTTERWISEASTAAYGMIGRMFDSQFAKTGCTQRIDVKYRGLAHYTSFSLSDTNGGFANRITYGPASVEDLTNLYSSKVHEQTHAIQKMNSAALHASPYNPNTRIIICPRDWVLLQERCEQGAYAMQALFNSILAQSIPETRELSEGDALSVDDFDALRAANHSFADTLVAAARHALDKSFYSDNPDSETRFRNYYQDYALKGFKGALDVRQSKAEEKGTGQTGLENIIFVRAEAEDIAAIGASCGPNVFGEGWTLPEFLNNSPMLPSTRKELDTINARIGIYDENALPTLGEALAMCGMTRADFIAASYAQSSTQNMAQNPAAANQNAPQNALGRAQNNGTPRP